MIKERLKGKFTQRWLSRSDEYYSPIFQRLYGSQYAYLERKGYGVTLDLEAIDESQEECIIINEEYIKKQVSERGFIFNPDEYRAMGYLEIGLGDYYEIFTSINALNRGFIKLLEEAEPLAAMPLIRLQLDNLTYLAAELKHPFRVLYKVFREGKQLIDIKIKNKSLIASSIRKELDEKHHYKLEELYRTYSCFVHPSIKQTDFEVNGYFSLKKGKEVITKAEMKRLSSDMIYINRIISINLLCQIFSYNSGLKEKKETNRNE